MSFLRRNLSMYPKEIRATCYKSLVRPQLEYAAFVWDPHTKSNICKLESVQRRAAKFCYSDYQRRSSITTMMENLGWEQLHARRQQTKAIMLYRIVNQLVDIQAASILIPTGTHIRGHVNRLLPPKCSVNACKYSFRLWNSLPEEFITATSLDVFKARIGAAVP